MHGVTNLLKMVYIVEHANSREVPHAIYNRRLRAVAPTYICTASTPFFRPDQMKMVDSGPYGLVRHPVYTSLMLAFWITPTLVGISCHRFIFMDGTVASFPGSYGAWERG